ncbi:MAG TPA: arsenite methyltransferase [Solirubrobacteraceae bacterium]|nr:arsenite methyltransferase [Solirubrobacteraceae bacterium]
MAELTDTTDLDATRAFVRDRYAEAARANDGCDPIAGEAGCGCGGTETASRDSAPFGAGLYDDDTAAQAPEQAVTASLGCGVPTAVADLPEGETVLDLGSGAGADVLISARRVGPTGRAIGLDMTDEMLERARANAREAGVDNAEFVKGYIEEIPLPDASVDVVISNCVINLSADKDRVLREVARVLRPGGRLAVSDVVADPDMDEATRADMAQWTGCVAGALTQDEYAGKLAAAGLVDVEVRETHRVHPQAASANVRARKP